SFFGGLWSRFGRLLGRRFWGRFHFGLRLGYWRWRGGCGRGCRCGHHGGLPLLAFSCGLGCGFRRVLGSSGGRGGFSSGFGRASTAWSRRWWRRWRREWFEEFQRLGARAQLAVQQQHEDIVRNFWILRQLRRDEQLRHFRKRNLLLDLPPLGQIILDLLLDCLLLRRDRQEQHHFRARGRKQLPGTRWGGGLFAAQALGQFFGVVFDISPGFHQIFARNHFLNFR